MLVDKYILVNINWSFQAHFGVWNVATIGAVIQYIENITTMFGLQLDTQKVRTRMKQA